MDINEYSADSIDSGLGGTSSPCHDYLSSDSFGSEMDNISQKQNHKNKIKYLSRSFIEMPQTGEVNYISTIVGVSGNPVYKGHGVWVKRAEKCTSVTIKVDKDDIRAKRHYVKTLNKDGKEIKIWECGLCGKEFRFQYTLVRHIPTHTDVRNYQCDLCPKAFRQLSTLAQHKATHWNMRPFSCDFCTKSFNRISTLISHKKIHYDEKKHVCDYCGKGFHQKGNLRNHMYTHTNERPYKCEICGKGFNQKSNLVCHKISTHSRKENYHCRSCSMSFGKHNLYKHHLESIHGMTINNDSAKLMSSGSNSLNQAEPQCAIVDEVNNIFYSLPVSVDSKGNQDKGFYFGSLSSTKNIAIQNEVIASIDQEPTRTMFELVRNNIIPFALFYGKGAIHPKICKIIVKINFYILINPSKSDISKYFVTNCSTNKTPKFPIVATIFEKEDDYGTLRYIVIPAGIQTEIIQSTDGNTAVDNKNKDDQKITLHSENSNEVVILPKSHLNGFENNDAEIIYTKNQPKPNTIKIKQEKYSVSISKIDICSKALTPSSSSLQITSGAPQIVSVYNSSEKVLNKNLFICKTAYKSDKLLKVEGISSPEHMFKKEHNSHAAGTINQQTIKVKKEFITEGDELDEQSHENIDPLLFSQPDIIKEPLSSNLDFESNMDFLDLYSFNDEFLDQESQNYLNEAPLPDFPTSPKLRTNPVSPAYPFNSLL